MRFQNLELLLLLWVVPLLIGVCIYGGYQRRQALTRFAAANLLPLLNTSMSYSALRWKAGLLVAAFAFGVVAVSRPVWNPVPKKLERRGRDVIFLLDVSKSMLAEDLVPNRLARAKLAIADVVDRLAGDRVGLLVFAGNGVVKCPLTLDYGFFRMMLDTVGIDSVSRGGTMIGDAIRTAMDEVFDDVEKQYKDIILITDGEDHDSFPVEAATAAGQKGIRLIAIGIGDEDQGRRIPVTDQAGHRSFLQYQGQEVWTKLDGDTLRKMVNATPGGRYLNVATGTIDLGEVYAKLVVTAAKKKLESTTVQRYEEKYQIFLGVMFALLCIEILVRERKRSG
jgi:Ca-activated chloride channel family protein